MKPTTWGFTELNKLKIEFFKIIFSACAKNIYQLSKKRRKVFCSKNESPVSLKLANRLQFQKWPQKNFRERKNVGKHKCLRDKRLRLKRNLSRNFEMCQIRKKKLRRITLTSWILTKKLFLTKINKKTATYFDFNLYIFVSICRNRKSLIEEWKQKLLLTPRPLDNF